MRVLWLTLAACFALVAVVSVAVPRVLRAHLFGPLVESRDRRELNVLFRIIGLLCALVSVSCWQHRNGASVHTQRAFGVVLVGLASFLYSAVAGGLAVIGCAALGAVGGALGVLAKDGMDFVMM